MKILVQHILPRRTVAFCAGLALIATAGLAQAQMGPGMMGPQERGYDAPVERSAPQHMRGTKGRGMHDGPGMMGQCMMMGQGMMGGGMDMMGPGMMGGGMGMMMDPAMMFDLTEEQRQEMRSMQRDMRREHMNTMLDVMDLRDEMWEEMLADRPDPERVRELHSQMAEHHGEIMESRVEMRNRMYDLLTDEQREQMREMRQQPQRERMGR